MIGRTEAALFLLEQGIVLTPLVPGKKRPKTSHWQTGAGSVRRIEDLNGQDYGAMIWDGILGIDLDVKNVDGIEYYSSLIADITLPKTLSTRTASGGLHYYFTLPIGSKFSGPIKRDDIGIEVYTHGRQFCVIKDGYEVECHPIAEAPEELLKKLESLRNSLQPLGSKWKKGRNNTMISKVGVWIGMGLDVDDISELAEEENEKFETPLPEKELTGLVRGAARRYPKGSLLQDWYLAKAIAEMHRDRVRFCVEENQLYVRQATRWKPDPTLGLITQLINESRSTWIAEASRRPDRAKRLINRLLDLGNVSKRKNVIEDLQRQTIIHVSASTKDNDPRIVGCRNGWVDFEGDELGFHEGCPESFVTKSLNANYDPRSDCPIWKRALKVWFPDPAVLAFAKRVAGYVLAGGNEREVLFFLQGPAASGKSKFTAALLHMLGEYGIAIRVETITDRRRSAAGASEDLARMAGARLAVTDEPAQGMRFNEALVKSLAGGDRINARGLYQKSFDFDSRLVLMIHSNFDLYAAADDGGFWRRLVKIPFVTKIAVEDRDPRLLEKLKAESDGILRWAIEGWIEYQRVGLNVPEAVRQASRQYRDSNDLVGTFIREKYKTEEHGRVKPKDLWDDYKDWCKDAGIKNPGRRKDLITRVESHGFSTEDNGHGSLSFVGLVLKVPGDTPGQEPGDAM